MLYMHKTIAGYYITESSGKIKEFIKNENDDQATIKTLKKYPHLQTPDERVLKLVLTELRSPEFIQQSREHALVITKAKIKAATQLEYIIIETVTGLDELTKIINMMVKRAREWYALYNPEHERSLVDNEVFVKEIMRGSSLPPSKMGRVLSPQEKTPLQGLCVQIEEMMKLKVKQESYLTRLTQEFCPNISAVAEPLIAARLLTHSRSLKRLAMMPASTVQLLGAETALFRHLRTGAKAPRHGLIVAHPLLASAPQKMHGKIARSLADKISLAAKIDYFKGEFIGDKLRQALEEKWAR